MAGKITGGYSIEVIYDSDKERFKCVLCYNIIKIATHGCTSHVFCKECIQEYIERNRSIVKLFCPAGCGKLFNKDKLQFNEAIDHCVNTIACKCPDCSWKGDFYDFVEQHELTCIEKKVQCHLCNDFIKRKELEAHVSDFCQHRKMECQYCSKEVPYHEHLVHEDICQNSEVECYYKNFGCTELVKRKLMEFHNEKSNQKHLLLVAKSFENKTEYLQLANKKLEEENLTIKTSYTDLDEKLKTMTSKHKKSIETLEELKKENIHMKCQISSFKRIFLKECFKKILEVEDNGLLVIKVYNIKFSLLKKYFDRENYSAIADSLIKKCKELEEYKDEVVELIAASPMVRFAVEVAFILFFKIESFTTYVDNESGELLLQKENGKYFYSNSFGFHHKLCLFEWTIKLTDDPVDLSKPDKRFELSLRPLRFGIYGCLWQG